MKYATTQNETKSPYLVVILMDPMSEMSILDISS